MNYISYFILFFSFPLIFSGQIHTWDISQDFNNYGLAQKISINFKLDSSLPINSYLRVKLPFSIDGANMAAYYIESDLCSFYFDFKLSSIVRSTLTVDTGTFTYLISFFSELYSQTTNPATKVALLPDVWYQLVIVFNSVVNQGTDTSLPIAFSTISGNFEDFIIYGINNNVGTLKYIDPPAYSLLMTSNSTHIRYNDYEQLAYNDYTSFSNFKRSQV